MLTPLDQIAVRRLTDDSNHYLIRWWCDKYKRPSNHPLLLSLTWEELYLEYMTSYYDNDQEALQKARRELEEAKNIEWKGETSEEYERKIKEKLEKKSEVDRSRWQTDIKKGEDEFDDIYED